MDRRTLLSVVAAGVTTLLSGCLGVGDETGDDTGAGTGDGSDDGSDDDVDEEETPTETHAPGPPRLEDTSFEVLRVDAGVAADRTDWSVEDGLVTVEGTIRGRDTCYTARLTSAAYDADADLLSVEIESYRDADPDEACAMTFVEIDYRARFTFSSGTPADVEVDHHSPDDR